MSYLNIAGWVANSVDPDEMCILWHLIWVYTVCSGLSVQIHMGSTVMSMTRIIQFKHVLKIYQKTRKSQPGKTSETISQR